jgi:4-hydroxy-tetrahydrodipicolinate synthase
MPHDSASPSQRATAPSSAPRWRPGAPLCGIVPPLATPLAGPDALDEAGLERLVERLVDGGVHGVFLLGTTGEAAALSPSLRRRLVERATRLIDGRLPVLVGVTDNSVVEMVAYAAHAADCGADAVVVTSPFFLMPEQAELEQFVRRVTEGAPLPVFLYNMPRLTKTWFEPETVARLLQLPRIVGVKDSSGDLEYFARLAALRDVRSDYSLLMGPEELLVEAIRLGAHGCVGGGANAWPQLLVALYEAAVAGDAAQIDALQARLQRLSRMFAGGGYAVGVVRALKAALHALGVCSDRLAEPFRTCNAEERALVTSILQEEGLLPTA